MQAGELSQLFNISIFDDDIIEENETFTVQIVSVSTCGVIIQHANGSEITIIDNEITITESEGTYYICIHT